MGVSKVNTTIINKKKKQRFNIIDLLVLILILAIISGGVYYFASPDFNNSKSVDIQYTILIKSIKSIHRGKIAVGDTVVDTKQLCEIGKVTSVSVTAATTTTVDRETGEVLLSDVPGYISVKVTVSAKAELKCDVYYINGMPLRVGEAIDFRVPNFCNSGFCESLKIITEEV